MKLTPLLTCAAAVFLAAHANATIYNAPHTLSATGTTTQGPTTSQIVSPMSTTAMVDAFGPDGDTGAFTYNYADAIRWTGTDFEGRTFELGFNVQFCQCRPEGGAFRFEMIADPVLLTFQGLDVNAHATGLDISNLTPDVDPIGDGTGVTLPTPAMHFAGEDTNGHAVVLDLNEGALQILPAPSSLALLGLAALAARRRRA
jgi:hypothetical protein